MSLAAAATGSRLAAANSRARCPAAVPRRGGVAPCSRRTWHRGGAIIASAAEVSVTTVTELTDRKHFDAVLAEASAADELIVVDYFTTWCGPCKLIAPKVEEIAAEYASKGVRVCKVTCDAHDDNKRWAQAIKIKTLPTFRLYKGGSEDAVAEMTGTKLQRLIELIQEHSSA